MRTWKLTIIIIFSFIYTIISIFILFFLEISLFIKLDNFQNKLIIDSLLNFKHNKVVYYDYNDIFYSEQHFSSDNEEIIYIDDYHIISYVENIYFILYLDGSQKKINSNMISGDQDTVFIVDEYIYSYSYKNEHYFKYDIINNNRMVISLSDYYNAFNGERYKCTIDDNNIIIYDRYSDEANKIKLTDLTTKEKLRNIGYISYFDITNHRIIGDNLFIKIKYRNIHIIISYNLLNYDVDVYDWFCEAESVFYHQYLDFCIFNISPSILDIKYNLTD